MFEIVLCYAFSLASLRCVPLVPLFRFRFVFRLMYAFGFPKKSADVKAYSYLRTTGTLNNSTFQLIGVSFFQRASLSPLCVLSIHTLYYIRFHPKLAISKWVYTHSNACNREERERKSCDSNVLVDNVWRRQLPFYYFSHFTEHTEERRMNEGTNRSVLM
jgi:hypothetical protein